MVLDTKLNSLKKTVFEKTFLFAKKHFKFFSVYLELKFVAVLKNDLLKNIDCFTVIIKSFNRNSGVSYNKLPLTLLPRC